MDHISDFIRTCNNDRDVDQVALIVRLSPTSGLWVAKVGSSLEGPAVLDFEAEFFMTGAGGSMSLALETLDRKCQKALRSRG